MRHRKHTVKLGRSGAHRKALLSSLVGNFIRELRIKTTLAKGKQARSLAEKMVTLGKKGTLAARRRALALLRREDDVVKLFDTIAPQYRDRVGGYTRIVKLGRRPSDGSEMILLEWIGLAPVVKPTKEPRVKADGKDIPPKKE